MPIEGAEFEDVCTGFSAYVEQVHGRSIGITHVAKPERTGFSSDTFIVELTSDTLPARLVVQAVPPGPALFDDPHLARSFELQQTLADAGVAVPSVRWLCLDPSWLGAPFLVMDFVEGDVPPDRPAYHLQGWVAELEFAKRRAVWLSGIAAMAELHRVDASRLDFLGPPMGARQRLIEWREYGEALGGDAEPSLLAALDTLSETAPDTLARVSVHWGDAKMANTMFDGTRVAALMDWELCGRGDAAEDLGHWFSVDWFYRPG